MADEEEDIQVYPPAEVPVMIESEFDAELIEHVGELITQVVRDDPMFCEKHGNRIEQSWHPAEVAEKMVQRLIFRAMTERL